MRNKRLTLALLAVCGASLTLMAGVSFEIANDHPNMLYRVGETATFTVTAMDGDKPATTGAVEVVLDNFGASVQLSNRVDLACGNPFTVRGSLAEPGFLRLTLGSGAAWRHWSVGYDPEKIVKGSPSPADFDEFWAAARAKLAKEVPLDAKLTKVPERSTADFDYYRISFATFGRRVYGFMSVPTDKTKSPYPVEFSVAPAGLGGWSNRMEGAKDRIVVFFSVFPWAPQWDWEELGLKGAYDCMVEACRLKYGVSGYWAAGLSESREAYFYYPVLLGLDRAVDYIAERPDVDRRRFRYQGTSQGGGFGFFLTALNHTFTRAVFFVPAITDTMGSLKGRQSGWPQPVENQREENRASAAAFAPYFDGANFASRIACPVRVAVGLADDTCPPCAVYAAYNEIPVEDKAIVLGAGMTHACFQEFYTELMDWLAED